MAINKLSTNASLKDVMDKFEEISLYDFSNIDIITASELPTYGKEGQICIITSNKPNKIIVDFERDHHSFDENDIFLKCYTNDGDYFDFVVKSKNITININLRECFVKRGDSFTRIKSYIYINGIWVYMNKDMPLYQAPNFLNQDVYGSFYRHEYSDHVESTGLYTEFYYNKDGYMYAKSQGNSTLQSVQNILTSNAIDVSSYSKIQFDLKATIHNGELNLGLSSYKGSEVNPKRVLTYDYDGIIEFDISNINQYMHVGFLIKGYTNGGKAEVFFRSIKLLA